MKKCIYAVLLIGLALAAAYLFFGGRSTKIVPATPVGNQTCPVTGNPVDGLSQVTHQNKTYNLCSPGCATPFSQEPDRYAEIAQQSAPTSPKN